MTPVVVHSVFWANGTAGPVVPGGGTAAGSIAGGLIAHADGLVSNTTAEAAAAERNAIHEAGTARIID
jgi:hypothetical protein